MLNRYQWGNPPLILLSLKWNKARKYINKVESYAQKKQEMMAQAEDNEGGKENDFSEKVDDVQE